MRSEMSAFRGKADMTFCTANVIQSQGAELGSVGPFCTVSSLGRTHADAASFHMETEKMKTICVDEFGGPEALKLEEVVTPKPSAGEALVRIYAAGVILTTPTRARVPIP